MRLVDALRSLDASRFDELLIRRRVVVHPERKADVIEQAARALAYPPVLETQSRWTPELREAASSLAVRPDGVHRADLGPALAELLEHDLVLVDPSGRVHMPGAYRFQILPSPLDPPRRLRVLLHGISEPELRDIEKVHIGRRTTLPRALVADELLHRFENSEQVASSLRGLTPEGRRLLRAIDARGGELATSDIQALSHDPRRYVVAPGARLSASSMSYELVRAGFLIPTKPGIYTVPDEVGEVVGRKRRSALAEEKAAVLDRVQCEDLSPARARIARDAGPLAVCLLSLLRRAGARLKADAGAPRSRVKQVGSLLGLSEREAEILVALGRAADLPHDGAPADQATTRLFECWLRGGGWDEGRDPEDAFRAGPRLARVRSGLEGLRSTVVSLLRSLPATRFAPLDDLVEIVERDPLAKTFELARSEALRRAPESFRRSTRDSLTRVFQEVLPALGMVDVGAGEQEALIRLSARGRAITDGVADTRHPPTDLRPAEKPARSSWLGPRVLRLSSSVRVSDAIAFGALGSLVPHADGASLTLTIEKDTLRRSHRRGARLRLLRRRLEVIAGPLPEEVVTDFETTAVVKVALVPATGFLAVDDSLRRRLLTEDQEESIFYQDSPPGGLLVRPGLAAGSLEALLREVGAVLDTPQKGIVMTSSDPSIGQVRPEPARKALDSGEREDSVRAVPKSGRGES